jgi:hypothetical protein
LEIGRDVSRKRDIQRSCETLVALDLHGGGRISRVALARPLLPKLKRQSFLISSGVQGKLMSIGQNLFVG